MKIKIDNAISFNAELPEVIDSPEQLDLLINKLTNIRRFVGFKKKTEKVLSVLSDDEEENIKRRVYIKRGSEEWKQKRADVIRLVKTYYLGSEDEKLALAQEMNKDWVEIAKRVSGMRKQYEIDPTEVGLIRFPEAFKSITEEDKLINQSPEISIKPEYDTYSMSQLNSFGWDKLEYLSERFNLEKEFFLQCKITNSKDILITELSRLMRISKNKKSESRYIYYNQ